MGCGKFITSTVTELVLHLDGDDAYKQATVRWSVSYYLTKRQTLLTGRVDPEVTAGSS